MKRALLPILSCAAAGLAPVAARAAFNPAVVSDDARWVVYADLNALRGSAVGKQLIDAAVKAQMAKGLPIQVNVAKTLSTVGSVTAYGANFSRDPKRVDGTAIFQGTADLPKIAQALLIQGLVSHPEAVAEVKDLGFPAYSIRGGKGDGPGLVVAFPPGGEVLLGKSEAQLRRARDLLAGEGRSLAQAPDSALTSLLPNADRATFFAASVVPSDAVLPADAPQTRILHMASSASVALGEEGAKTVARVVLMASSDDMADKLEKILQGMTAMMSLVQDSDQQITDFLNSAKVDRLGDTVTLKLAYSSAKLAEMIQKMAAQAPAAFARSAPRSGPTALERALGKQVYGFATTNMTLGSGASAPAAAWHLAPAEVSLVNGAQISVRILAKNPAGPARFDEMELTPAGGGTPLVFSRRLATAIRRPLLHGAGRDEHGLIFGFPGEDGNYILRVRVAPAGNAETRVEIWVKNPADSAPPPSQQP